MTTVILGIDPGTRITGYGLISIKNSERKALDYGAIRPPAVESLSKRYHIIYTALTQLIKQYSPTILVVESQFMHKNAQSAMKIGMAKAMALLAAEEGNLKIYEYTPKKAKKAVVGRGSASKEQVQKMMQMLLKLPKLPTPEDAADALALCYCHANTLSVKKG